MTRHRTIFLTMLLAAFLAVPSSASAGSLLSGYGGPGGGAQAIIGSALVNGPGGGAGGSAGSGSSPDSGGGTGSTAAGGGQGRAGASGVPGARTGTPSGAQGSGHASGGNSGGATRSGANAEASGGASAAYSSPGSPRIRIGAAAADDDDMGVLSFTGSDLLLLALVLGVLAVTAGLTRRLAGTQRYS
jgi:hypothetical protein